MVAARNQINDEFKKNKHVQNEGSIDELVKMASEVEKELRENVIQAREKEPLVYGNECPTVPPKNIANKFSARRTSYNQRHNEIGQRSFR